MSESKSNNDIVPKKQIFKMSLGKTIAFSIDDLKKELSMNSNGDLIFGGEVIASNLYYFYRESKVINSNQNYFPGTIVSLIYDNGVKTIVPFSLRYSKDNRYNSLRPFGVITQVNKDKYIVKTRGIIDLPLIKVKKLLKYGDKLFLKDGVVVSNYISIKNKKYIGYILEECEKSDHAKTVKAYVNFESV